MQYHIITIDGPSGAGKSTVAKIIAQKLNFKYLDTGVLYRIVALLTKDYGIDIENKEQIANICKNLKINMYFDENNEFRVFTEIREVTDEIRDELISKNASIISAYPEVRENLLDVQRNFASENNIVAEGRDCGSVIFPNSKYKFYLDADLETRVLRRYKQLNETIDIYDIRIQLQERDKRDSERKIAPLMIPEKAIVVDSSNKLLEEVIDFFMVYLHPLE